MERPNYPKFNELLSKTNAEMRRLGLSEIEGRELLEGLYNKRSRLQLTEEELDNFLLYLQLSDPPTSNSQ